MKPTLGTAPLCPNADHDSWLGALVNQSVQLLLHDLGSHAIDAVILTGSAARGEASVLPTLTGKSLLGDLEFLVILKAPFKWSAARRHLAALSQTATQTIGASDPVTGPSAVIEFGPAGLVYLQRNIRPSIFAYDLKTHGRVVWGRANILTDITPFDAADIPREDALNLLMNRLIELSCLHAMPHQASAVRPYDRAYHLVKVSLDLAGSALAFAGSHVSPYRDRGHRFRHLLTTQPELAHAVTDIDGFCDALDRAVITKLNPTEDALHVLHDTVTTSRHAEWGRALWLWEIQQFLGTTSRDLCHALQAYLAQEPRASRLKGWIKFFRHPLRPPGTLSWPRLARLMLDASPQRLTYAAALLAQAGILGAAGPHWQIQLDRLAPIPLIVDPPDQAVRDIGRLWQWLIRNN